MSGFLFGMKSYSGCASLLKAILCLLCFLVFLYFVCFPHLLDEVLVFCLFTLYVSSIKFGPFISQKK